jgi:hypothetical protein
METQKRGSFPKWLFAIIAIGGLVASGIFIGIMSVEGASTLRLVQAVAYGLLGLLMFWGAVKQR